MIGLTLAVLGALAFLAIGVAALVAPKTSSEQYGLPSSDPYALAFVRALGARDVVLGLIVVIFVVGGSRGAAGAVLAVCVLVALADGLLVYRERGTAAMKSLITHGVGGVALLVAWAALRSGF